MERKYLILLFLFCFSISVIGEECVVYTFGDDFDSLFSNEFGVCLGMLMWQPGRYSSIPLDSPHPLSTTFISPEYLLSCVSSFTFPMSGLGTVEVNLYMDPASNSDQISIVVHEVVPGSTSTVVGNRGISAMIPDFQVGWHTLRIPLTGTGTFDGYVTLMGMAASGSIVLIDSFRYIPPSYDEELCVLYKEANDSTTSFTHTDSTSTPTFTTTSISDSTTEISNSTTQRDMTTEFGTTYTEISTTDTTNHSIITDATIAATKTTEITVESDSTISTEISDTTTTSPVLITETTTPWDPEKSTMITTEETEITDIVTITQELKESDYTTAPELSTSFTDNITETDMIDTFSTIDPDVTFTTQGEDSNSERTTLDTTNTEITTEVDATTEIETTTPVIILETTTPSNYFTDTEKPLVSTTDSTQNTDTEPTTSDSSDYTTKQEVSTSVTSDITGNTQTDITDSFETTNAETTVTNSTQEDEISSETTTLHTIDSEMSSTQAITNTNPHTTQWTETDITTITQTPENVDHSSTITTTTELEATTRDETVMTNTIPEAHEQTSTQTDPEQQTTTVMVPTLIPDTDNPNTSFWTPLTISMFVLLSIIVLIVIAAVFYALGKKRAKQDTPQFVFADYEDLPKTIMVPRVTKILVEPNNFKKTMPV